MLSAGAPKTPPWTCASVRNTGKRPLPVLLARLAATATAAVLAAIVVTMAAIYRARFPSSCACHTDA